LLQCRVEQGSLLERHRRVCSLALGDIDLRQEDRLTDCNDAGSGSDSECDPSRQLTAWEIVALHQLL
jgi:hypothetical protein